MSNKKMSSYKKTVSALIIALVVAQMANIPSQAVAFENVAQADVQKIEEASIPRLQANMIQSVLTLNTLSNMGLVKAEDYAQIEEELIKELFEDELLLAHYRRHTTHFSVGLTATLGGIFTYMISGFLSDRQLYRTKLETSSSGFVLLGLSAFAFGVGNLSSASSSPSSSGHMNMEQRIKAEDAQKRLDGKSKLAEVEERNIKRSQIDEMSKEIAAQLDQVFGIGLSNRSKLASHIKDAVLAELDKIADNIKAEDYFKSSNHVTVNVLEIIKEAKDENGSLLITEAQAKALEDLGASYTILNTTANDQGRKQNGWGDSEYLKTLKEKIAEAQKEGRLELYLKFVKVMSRHLEILVNRIDVESNLLFLSSSEFNRRTAMTKQIREIISRTNEEQANIELALELAREE